MSADARSGTDSFVIEPRLAPAFEPEYDFFWEGTRARELRFQRCTNCDRPRYPVAYVCRFCGSFEWRPWTSNGRGTVFSYSFIRHPRVNYIPDDAALAVISLEEGVRFPSNVLHVSPETIHFGSTVELIWETSGSPDGLTEILLPMFRLT